MTFPTAFLQMCGVGLAAVGLLGPFMSASSRDAQRGLAAWEAGNSADAMADYAAARERAKDPEAVDFNIGAAAYRTGDMQTALQKFSAARRSPLVPAGAAAYNAGNALFRANQLEDALAAYREALRANPDDADARYNFELTRERLENAPPDSSGQGQKNQDGQQKDEKQQGDQDRNQEGQDQQQSAEQNDQGQQGQQDQASADQGDRQDRQDQASADQGDQEDQQEQAAKPGEETQQPPDGAKPAKGARLLTKEEAERLLNAVTPEERELLMARLKAASRKKTEKDW